MKEEYTSLRVEHVKTRLFQIKLDIERKTPTDIDPYSDTDHTDPYLIKDIERAIEMLDDLQTLVRYESLCGNYKFNEDIENKRLVLIKADQKNRNDQIQRRRSVKNGSVGPGVYQFG